MNINKKKIIKTGMIRRK